MTRRGKLMTGSVVAGSALALGVAGFFLTQDPMEEGGTRKGTLDGAVLARQYCAGCHLFPEPGLLDKRSWSNGVLPEMGRYLGRSGGVSSVDGGALTPTLLQGPRLGVSEAEWSAIVSYYVGEAPETLTGQAGGPSEERAMEGVTGRFRVRRLAGYDREVPMTCMVKMLGREWSRTGLLCVGDGMSRTLEVLRTVPKEGTQTPTASPGSSADDAVSSRWAVERVFGVEFDSGPIWLEGQGSKVDDKVFLDVLLVGRLFPSDLLKGRLVRLEPPVGGTGVKMETVLRNLRRPVHMARGDLNGDGAEDFVVCEFGNREGRLVCLLAAAGEGPEGGGGAGNFVEIVLLDRPGAIRSEVRDMNGDGRLDVVALMGQAREGVYLFLNSGGAPVEGRGSTAVFRQEVLVEEHPAFGFSYLELVDFDGDGDLDLLTTNGDNGESYGQSPGGGDGQPAPHKPYHGVRLYTNDGKNQFRQEWFFLLHGAYGARAADFDLDGDLDIAAISYFPSYGSYGPSPSGKTNGGSPGFAYLENVGGAGRRLEFRASTIAEHADGRWMVMDAGDLDADGDTDVVIGSLVLGPTSVPFPPEVQERWRSNAPAVLVLENLTR